MIKLKSQKYYTFPNSGLIVHIHKIRYISSDYIKVWIRYFSNPSLRFQTEERNVKLYYKNIQHWQEISI